MKQLFRSLIVLTLWLTHTLAFAQGTAFTYQGHLSDNGAPASGSYDLVFELFDAESAGTPLGSAATRTEVAVANGVFTVTLDFGDVFTGADRWLEIAVRATGSGDYTTLAPRQKVTPAPYAMLAGLAAVASSVANNTIVADNIQNSVITADKLATTAAVKTLNSLSGAVTLSAGANVTLTPSGNTIEIAAAGGGSGGGEGWGLAGNTISSGDFLGTVNSEALDFRVNNKRALRLQSSFYPNVIAGDVSNIIETGTTGASIGGGKDNLIKSGSHSTHIGGGEFNTVEAGTAVIAGGFGNRASGEGAGIGGGDANVIELGASFATIGGGIGNTVEEDAERSVIAGGWNNVVATGAKHAVIPGGYSAKAVNYGQFAYASGQFGEVGDAQMSFYVLRGVGTVTLELFLDEVGERLKIPAGHTWMVEIHIVGRDASASGAYRFEGVIKNVDGTVSWVGTAISQATVIATERQTWSVNVEADDTNDALAIKVSGMAGVARWVARVRTVEVKL